MGPQIQAVRAVVEQPVQTQQIFKDVITPFIQETMREVQVPVVETVIKQREVTQVVPVECKVPKVFTEVQEDMQEIPVVLRHERVVEVPEVGQDECLTLVPRVEYVEVPK